VSTTLRANRLPTILSVIGLLFGAVTLWLTYSAQPVGQQMKISAIRTTQEKIDVAIHQVKRLSSALEARASSAEISPEQRQRYLDLIRRAREEAGQVEGLTYAYDGYINAKDRGRLSPAVEMTLDNMTMFQERNYHVLHQTGRQLAEQLK
jgi:hypothetical protein